MTTDIPNLPSQYDPHNTENKWQQTWFERSVFRADPQKKGDPFCIVIPPPNVTGKLHMGHAFNTSLIDTVVRYHRMKGEKCSLSPRHRPCQHRCPNPRRKTN